MAASDDYDTAMQAVATALGTNDYTTARKQLRVARAHALRIPDSSGGEGTSLKQRALSDLDSLEQAIDKAEVRGNKFQVISRLVPGN